MKIFVYKLLSLFFILTLGLKVIAYDFGIKHDLLRRVASYGCKITMVPSNRPPSETLKIKPDRILFSNGPGDPYAVHCAAVTVKELRGFSRVPVGEAEYIFLDIFAGGNAVLILIYATAYRVFLQKFLLRWRLAFL
ncbi:hypothetical protein Peur_019208 [Populus x canadensis]